MRIIGMILCLVFTPLIASAQVVDNLLENASFEDDSDILANAPQWEYWFSAADANVAFSYDEDAIDGALCVKAEILKTSATNWHIGLIQSVRELEAGEEYTLTFWAKAAKTRPISMEVKRHPNLGVWEGVTGSDYVIQTDWAEYTKSFVSPLDYPNLTSQLDFWLAVDSATLWFDFVHLYQGRYTEIEPAGYVPRAVRLAGKLPIRWAEIQKP